MRPIATRDRLGRFLPRACACSSARHTGHGEPVSRDVKSGAEHFQAKGVPASSGRRPRRLTPFVETSSLKRAVTEPAGPPAERNTLSPWEKIVRSIVGGISCTVVSVRAAHAMIFAAALAALVAGCTDRGEGLLGTGPDDRSNRGGGPDTVAVVASADTYFETTIDDGRYLVAGELASKGFTAVTFLKFESLPSADDELTGARLKMYVTGDYPPYSMKISRLDEAAPSEYPFWPGPPDGTDSREFTVTTVQDTTAPVEGFYYIEMAIPVDWIEGWIADPSTNHGLRVTGGRLDVSQSGRLQKRFWAGGEVVDEFSVGPRLETLKEGETDPQSWEVSEDFFIFSPSILAPVGEEPDLRLGGDFGYRLLLHFGIEDSLDMASINKALLTLTVDRELPQFNDGIFTISARPAAGEWKEDSTNVNVKLDPATTEEVEIDAEDGGDDEVVLDVTALVELFASGHAFDVGVLRTGVFSYEDQVAFYSSESSENAPRLYIVYTTPPGGRVAP
jgi:hypothetical protein